MEKVDQLSRELLDIVNAKIAMMERPSRGKATTTRATEVDRIKSIAGHLSQKVSSIELMFLMMCAYTKYYFKGR